MSSTRYPYPHRDGRPNKVVDKVVSFVDGKRVKNFYQKHWNSETQEFENGAGDSIRTFYRADLIEKHLKETKGQWILYICEGEKDADRGNADYPEAGLFTSLCMGANRGANLNVWSDHHSECFRDWKPSMVVIIADRDEPGIDFAKAIALRCHECDLRYSIVEAHDSIQTLGADLSDHIEAGFALEDLQVMDLELDIPVQAINPDTGIQIEQNRYFVDECRDQVMWASGLEQEWHLLQEGTSLYVPGDHLVNKAGQDLFMDRYHAMDQAGAPRQIMTRLRSMLDGEKVAKSMKQSRACLEVKLEELGEHRHPTLLNAPNCVVDLSTGEALQHDPSYKFTKVTGTEYDREAQCPEFLKHFEEWQPDPEIRSWLHRLMGMALTGHQEQLINIFYGFGADGKSTFTNIASAVLNDFAVMTKADTWMRSKFSGGGDAPRPDKTRLRGARLVLSTETGFDAMLDEVSVKGFVGGDPIAERALRRAPIEFKPSAALIFTTNNLMRIKDLSRGIQRRVRLIPWNANILPENQILDLDQKLLREEGPGIFRWFVKGAQAYLEQGLKDTPRSIAEQSKQYLESEDEMAEFIEANCDQSDPEALILKADLALKYNEWAEMTHTCQLSAHKLSRELKRRGFTERRSNGVRCWIGVQLRRQG